MNTTDKPVNPGFGIHFGAMSDPIGKQLKKQRLKFDTDTVAHFQKDSEALNRLRIRGYLNKSATDSATKSLFNKIKSHIQKENS